VAGTHEGLKVAIANAAWQRCRVHFMRNVLAHAGKQGRRVVAAFIGTGSNPITAPSPRELQFFVYKKGELPLTIAPGRAAVPKGAWRAGAGEFAEHSRSAQTTPRGRRGNPSKCFHALANKR